MNYTDKQIAEHGILMHEYFNNKSVEVQYRSDVNPGKWIPCSSPAFHPDIEYRKKPFTNEIGEVFTQEHIDKSTKVYYFGYSKRTIVTCSIQDVNSYSATDLRTSISKTQSGAMDLASMYLKKLNQ